ncbi:hypothetical protein ACOT81_27445 [Streptomyces sp. WI04-05B]|uniref:hypothetical protein n=1 Tax=Streptomyces TaxID=1883 RepID=UPI0029BC56F2|nr:MULTISPECIES: hypothetical protein [unclassified Streptomyces]MDX2546165.1 hypothetical protein [Streptomyces sp. WI04-05B]MDX2587145.1 hypothetical protein [Streptomyces sp. WI04-05A]MDX3750682.1 hypothetical protein [Streptomyces sp. AK08-02]
MSVQQRRWLLAPIRQWRTRRLMAQHGPSLTYATAFALITLATSPREVSFVQQSIRESDEPVEAGLCFDDWRELTGQERERRDRWLLRHDRSPIQMLGINGGLLKTAGLRVVDWGKPDHRT